jgi:hypothetical protein
MYVSAFHVTKSCRLHNHNTAVEQTNAQMLQIYTWHTLPQLSSALLEMWAIQVMPGAASR